PARQELAHLAPISDGAGRSATSFPRRNKPHHLYFRVAAAARTVELVEVFLPGVFAVVPEMTQILPAVNAGVVAVVEMQVQGVVAGRLDMRDLYVFLAVLKLFLAGAVAPHFGAGRLDAQVFAGQQ